MHIRRLVKSGASSHTVSLPKKWVERNKLDRGDIVYITEKGETEIVISPEKKEQVKEQKEITINIDGKDIGTLSREITSAYINNYNTINIFGKELVNKVKDVRKMLHDFVALEIAEQTSTKIVARDLLNLNEISVEKTIRRMDMMIRSIIEDSIASFDGKDLYEAVYYRDFDVNKQYFLMYRILKSSLDDPKVAESFKMTNSGALAAWFMAVNLEAIGDIAKTACLKAKDIKNKQMKDEIKAIFKKVEQEYLDAMKSYFTIDKKLADKVAENRNNVVEMCENYVEKNNKGGVAQIMGDLKEMENKVCTVARIVLDHC